MHEWCDLILDLTLQIYNDSLLINDECDTEDALNFLDQQMSDYDPTGQRNTQTDRFLKDLFQSEYAVREVLNCGVLLKWGFLCVSV